MRVLIVADNPVTANRIKIEMRHAGGCQVVGFLNGRRPCGLIAAREKPDVVLLDDMHSTALTLERTVELRQALPEAKLVMLTLCMEADWLAELSAAGIDAAIAKASTAGSIGTLVREVLRGNVFHAFASGTTHAAPVPHELTTRELETLRLAASGHSNRHIAERLWVTEQTVKFHLSNVYRKLGVANRTEASHVAHQRRLLGLETPATDPLGTVPVRAAA